MEYDFDRTKFCLKLRVLRELYGFSQFEMAEKLKIDRSSYSSYEIGRSMPPVCSLKMIAQIFQVSIDFLLDFKFQSNKEIEKTTNKIIYQLQK